MLNHGAKLAINTRSQGLYNDFDNYDGMLLNTSKKMAVFFNVVTNESMIVEQTTVSNSFDKSFSAPGLYTVDANFSCNGSSYSNSTTVGGELCFNDVKWNKTIF